jgi:hypothetical protein
VNPHLMYIWCNIYLFFKWCHRWCGAGICAADDVIVSVRVSGKGEALGKHKASGSLLAVAYRCPGPLIADVMARHNCD